MKALRAAIGQLILIVDAVTRPRRQCRTEQGQALVELKAKTMALYQFHACPFCVKTRRALHRMNVNIALLDAKNDAGHRQRLLAGGGKIQVPCLYIEEEEGARWLYESDAIVAYLQERFACMK